MNAETQKQYERYKKLLARAANDASTTGERDTALKQAARIAQAHPEILFAFGEEAFGAARETGTKVADTFTRQVSERLTKRALEANERIQKSVLGSIDTVTEIATHGLLDRLEQTLIAGLTGGFSMATPSHDDVIESMGFSGASVDAENEEGEEETYAAICVLIPESMFEETLDRLDERSFRTKLLNQVADAIDKTISRGGHGDFPFGDEEE